MAIFHVYLGYGMAIAEWLFGIQPGRTGRVLPFADIYRKKFHDLSWGPNISNFGGDMIPVKAAFTALLLATWGLPKIGELRRRRENAAMREEHLGHFCSASWNTLWLCQNSYWKWQFIVSFPMKNIQKSWFSIVMGQFTRGYIGGD